MSVREAYQLLNKLHNYTGPETKKGIKEFINARDIPITVRNRGGMIGMQEGGDVEPPVEPPEEDKEYTIEDVEAGQKKLVGDVATDPSKAIEKPEVDKVDPDTKGAEIAEGTGQAPKDATTVTETSTVDTTAQATEPTTTPVTKATTTTSAEKMKTLMEDVDPAKGDVTKEVVGQTKEDTAVSELDAAQIDKAQTVKDAPIREEQEGEMIDETSVVDQERVKKETQAKAASVKDELSTLMSEFDDGQTPAWAAGSMRKAMATLSARGLGASSLAGQAVIQAAMEAALPIAQIDAANKQQVAIENAKMAQTVDLNNLNARQALVMAEAAQLSQLELAGLSNLQQAQVENAKNFLQIDMANLANAQQTELFKGQQNANALLTDVASQNATEQFNAKSANQSAQFDNSLKAQVSQFNANQKNAIAQFNANEENAIAKYNAEVQNQRDQFNANNALIIAQANAKWRQDTTTLNTATQNQANFEFAKQTNALTNKQIDQIWQRERDIMSFAFTQSENALDRTLKVLLGDKTLEAVRLEADATEGAANAELFARVFFGNKGLLGFL